MAYNSVIVVTVSYTSTVLILVLDDIEPPVQLIFDAPMLDNDFVQAFYRQRHAEQIIDDLLRYLAVCFAEALDLPDISQTLPMIVFVLPAMSFTTVAVRVSMRP